MNMEKYYCDRCRCLSDIQGECPVCGGEVSKKIVIQVQHQSNKDEHGKNPFRM
ncbi:hypothetical protein [Falsibacillus albus]|uniref:hypothetical protein n=1 Tax=Falsibacillus albus TaxID=2478915 RepID=UPI0013146414|nr:hypothetical protein [Falsibacillus albus]